MLVREVDDGHDGWKKAFSDRDVASLDEQLHLREGYTNSVVVGVVTRSLRRQQQANIVGQIPTEHEQDQNDDDVVESTASAFDRAKRHKSRGSQRGPLVVDLDSGASKKGTQHQSEQANVELNDSRKSNKAVVAAPVEEPKFNCPICMCPFNEEMSTKCGHIFCKSCIKEAISVQAKCPTCRKDVTAEDLIRVFLPTTE
ncbi:PREDICTED: E3 ubiquitin-protein ligase RNF8-like [Brassica oleracea var. oleracea]|uniref:E3 ubiquitin-protein ligase RNF8-like n=1 Tax=Brassica oleracea var. oleracea TaxID=109376 RepID=UPI0006A7505E|nr:PREDICTED: E3 ubiquitin-protein ligase RNF8-like [Brassica oleracea var. oleracea]